MRTRLRKNCLQNIPKIYEKCQEKISEEHFAVVVLEKKWLLSRNKKLFTFIELEILFEQAQISVCLGDFLATLICLRFNFESETDTKERIKERRSFTLLLNNFINVSYKNFTFNYRVVEWNIVKSSSLILFVSRKEEKYTRVVCGEGGNVFGIFDWSFGI